MACIVTLVGLVGTDSGKRRWPRIHDEDPALALVFDSGRPSETGGMSESQPSPPTRNTTAIDLRWRSNCIVISPDNRHKKTQTASCAAAAATPCVGRNRPPSATG